MKFGVRKPSIKRSIKARTTGKIKRTVKKSINPLYGKKGMGWVNNPKKAAYNKVYNRTTIGVSDIIGSGSKSNSTNDAHDELLENNAACGKMTSTTSPRTWKTSGIIMKVLAVICAVVFGLPGLFGGMIPLLIVAIIAAVAFWKIGSVWSKQTAMTEETENNQMSDVSE